MDIVVLIALIGVVYNMKYLLVYDSQNRCGYWNDDCVEEFNTFEECMAHLKKLEHSKTEIITSYRICEIIMEEDYCD